MALICLTNVGMALPLSLQTGSLRNHSGKRFALKPDGTVVFEKDYKLRTVDELDKYINENKHLPGIASAKEVETEGLKVGEMNKAMMEKIEELTLYVIQLSKDNKRLQEKVDALKK